MVVRNIWTVLAVFLFTTCQTKKATEQDKVAKVDSVKISGNTSENRETRDSKQTKFDISNCIRGQAVPILKKDKYPNSSFKINEDGLSGTETTDLSEGDKLIIINGGCEYYVLIFRFETSRFQGDTTDINYWSSKIVDLMNGISDGVDAPINLKKGTMTLSEYIKRNQIKILEDITFEPGEIRTYLNVNRIQKIDNRRYGLEISYIVGPL
jgi:hypothetical protein